MRRRLVYLATAVVLGWTALFASVWSEARLDFIALAALLVTGAWWLVRRLPARPVSRWELRGGAAAALGVGIALAVLIPTTRVMCDCPMPPGVSGGFTCNCPVDRHMALRATLALGGLILSLILGWAARRRTLNAEMGVRR